MSKNEFLEELREALSSSLPAAKIQEHLSYYRDYIAGEVRNGRSEEEVLEELGDPWILARTLEISSGAAEEVFEDRSPENRSEDAGRGGNLHVFGLDTWWKKALFVLGILAILVLIFSIVTGVIAIVAKFAFPLLVVIIVLQIIKRKN